MQSITQITTVSSEFAEDFDRAVNALIADGWELSNMTVLPICDSVRYIATLVKIAER